MKTTITRFIAVFVSMGLSHFSFSQSLERSVIGATGGYAQSGGFQLSYTVGETSIKSVQAGEFQLTQGFQQPDGGFNVSIETDLGIVVSETAYPNPTQGALSLKLVSKKDIDLRISVYDTRGRKVFTLPQQIDLIPGIEKIVPLDISQQAPGIYLLELQEVNAAASKTFRVQRVD